MRKCQVIMQCAADIVEAICPPEHRQEAFGVAVLAIRTGRDAWEAVRTFLASKS